MCRIDAPFGNLTLDEKKDPTERFIQALDEFKAEGNFRKLMIKHFAENWQSVFVGIPGLESSLVAGKHTDTDEERCISVLLSNKTRLECSLDYYGEGFPDRKPYFRDFAIDVAKTLFPDSPYGFFSSGMNKIRSNYFLFVSSIYGEDYSFSKAVFDDEALNSLSEMSRNEVLWKYFDSISPIFRKLEISPNRSALLSELSSLVSSNALTESQSETLTDFFQGMEFIKLWIKSDAEAGRATYDLHKFIYSVFSPWEDIKCLMCQDKRVDDEVTESLKKVLDGFENEFRRILYINADLRDASCSDIEQWAYGIDEYVSRFSIDFDISPSGIEHLNVSPSKLHADVCSQLTPLQIETWIRWSVREDLKYVVSSHLDNTAFSRLSEKWLCVDYYDSWKLFFLEYLNKLSIENRMKVLSSEAPYQIGRDEEFNIRCSNLWKSQLNSLVKLVNFPKQLIPSWTIKAKSSLERDIYLPYVDQSIGILRGLLVKDNASEEELNRYHKQLENLFLTLDVHLPLKALRHRLLLMRSSSIAFADNSVSLRNQLNKDLVVKWYSPLTTLVENQFAYQVNGRRVATSENYMQVQNDFYAEFSVQIVEFCLSRLRLNKGEKIEGGTYVANQVVERASIWRQGYLKALVELGVDLNGKVHKTVNFTKKSDPEEAVRAIASECYKAVRRNAKKSPSTQDIKRSIVAAEWWLLMCQRNELGLEVNYEEALKTRRNLMRNP